MGLKIALRKVGLGPVQHAVKMRAIVVGQRKEHGVGLSFGRGVLISPGIEDAALRIDESRRIRVPKRPGFCLHPPVAQSIDRSTIGNKRFPRRDFGMPIAQILRKGARAADWIFEAGQEPLRVFDIYLCSIQLDSIGVKKDVRG